MRKRMLRLHRCWLNSIFPLLLRRLFKYSLQFTSASHQSLMISSICFSFLFDFCCFQSSQSLFSPAFQGEWKCFFPNTDRLQTTPAHFSVDLAQGLGWHCPKTELAATISLLHVAELFTFFILFTFCPVLFSLCFWTPCSVSNVTPNHCFWRY